MEGENVMGDGLNYDGRFLKMIIEIDDKWRWKFDITDWCARFSISLTHNFECVENC